MIRMRTLPAILAIGLGLTGALPHQSFARQKSHSPPFIVFATVFNEHGFAFPGAEARLRRAGEKKDRWEARSDRRGEFALRVPPGAEYELSVSAKGYKIITQKVDAREANRADLTLHLVPASKLKKDEMSAKREPAEEKPK
jgi:hypothetical protein